MLFSNSLAALTILGIVTQVQAKAVFAHFMVGLTAGYGITDWADDISKAKAVGLDGFAMNIGPQDGYTRQSLENAASAANSIGGFCLFISFDYLSGGSWDAGAVVDTIKFFEGKASNAHCRYNDKIIVSTFEGADSAPQWADIKAQTNCFFIPDWSSRGPGGIPKDNIDGAFSWDAWPHGPNAKDAGDDSQWVGALGGKPYMMGVSPWFYTNLPQYNKNWGTRGDDLWSTRWNQAAQIGPEFVEIISWNDYGESHYIGPIRPGGIVANAPRYVANNPHDAWRDILPYYISIYKNGGAPPVTKERVVYYHKPNPNSACSTDGTAGNQPGDTPYSITEVSLDQISVDTLTTGPATLSVQIGNNPATILQVTGSGASHFAVPFNGGTGPVVATLKRSNGTVAIAQGSTISTDCAEGKINFNAIVIGCP